MPTSSESADVPLQIEHTLHATCPPDVDRPAEWRLQVLDHLNRAGSEAVAAVVNESLHQGPMPTAERPSTPEDTTIARPTKSTQGISHDTHHLNTDGVNDDPLEERSRSRDIGKFSLYPPTSSALDLPFSPRLGVESTRVSRAGSLWGTFARLRG